MANIPDPKDKIDAFNAAFSDWRYEKVPVRVVQVLCDYGGRGIVKFSTDCTAIEPYFARVCSVSEFEAVYKRYCYMVEQRYGVRVDIRRPNMYRVHQQVIDEFNPIPVLSKWRSGIYPWEETAQPTVVPEPLPEPEFEVNLMEPLIGWKGFSIDLEKRRIKTTGYGVFLWEPDQTAVAQCTFCTKVVTEKHTYGFYATDKIDGAKNYGVFRGEVYGWGRYVRGDSGWRSEFAYPKNFFLEQEQVNPDLMDVLKLYHVPVYVNQPMKLYDPEEDGYANWSAEEDRNSRSVDGPSSEEDRSAN